MPVCGCLCLCAGACVRVPVLCAGGSQGSRPAGVLTRALFDGQALQETGERTAQSRQDFPVERTEADKAEAAMAEQAQQWRATGPGDARRRKPKYTCAALCCACPPAGLPAASPPACRWLVCLPACLQLAF